MIHDMISKCRHSDKIYAEVNKHFSGLGAVVELGCADGNNLIGLSTIIESGLGIEPNIQNFKLAQQNIKKYSHITVLAGTHRDLYNYADANFDLCITCSVIDHIAPEDLEECIQLLTTKCKNLLLIEPAVPGIHRQAKVAETTFWTNTWYYDYWKLFKEYNCTITPLPLSKTNSGPKYKKILVTDIIT